MGHDLYWYVLPRAIEHDTTKELCFQYEYEEYQMTQRRLMREFAELEG
jgi:hypothetical protein